MTTIDNKSTVIHKRIENIKDDIKAHRENIALLSTYAHRYFNPKKNCYAPRTAKYNHIARSEDRYRWTLKNLIEQVVLLENELAVLTKFGA